MKKKLCNFENLDRKLTEWGFPEVKSNVGFRVIKGIDFNKAYKEKNIEFRQDGIYLTLEGKAWKGYMHLAESYFSRFNDHPKFHLKKCTTIQAFIAQGTFRQRYIWSNSDTVDLVDDTTGEGYKNVKLRLCRYCSQMIFSAPSTTEMFFNKLDKTEIESENIVEVDILGYVKNWQKISRSYRESKDYICEVCGIKPQNKIDKHFWHTHHIDGNKVNNDASNLQCLCIHCHSRKDSEHVKNFNRNSMNQEMASFIKKYKNK